jgi:hypothetical protein
MANGQLGIVRHRRSDPDHHRINQCAQPMQVCEPCRAINIVRMAGCGGDSGIDGLAKLPDHYQIIPDAVS